MKINGIEFESVQFDCPNCDLVNEVEYRFVESNKSIQARCKCGKWIGNVKYDKRSKEQIRRDEINQWKEKRKMKGVPIHENQTSDHKNNTMR